MIGSLEVVELACMEKMDHGLKPNLNMTISPLKYEGH
jgi:hypothetical protein